MNSIRLVVISDYESALFLLFDLFYFHFSFILFHFSHISFNFFVLFLLLCYFYVILSRFLTNIMYIDVMDHHTYRKVESKYSGVNTFNYYMEESVLLGTKPLGDSIRHFIRDPSGVFSVCHLCECRIVR